MSTKEDRGHSDSPGKTAYAERLEHIRALRGVPDVKAFHAKLVARFGDEETRSYASARYYHYDRDPPVDYLHQVSVVYDVPIGWLVSGEGSPSHFKNMIRPGVDSITLPVVDENIKDPEIVGGAHIHPNLVDEAKGLMRVMGAIREATEARSIPSTCQTVIWEYLCDLAQSEGLASFGWRGGLPQREDTDELRRLASEAIDRDFGLAIQAATSRRPVEVVASVLAAAIPLYLRRGPAIKCPGCGKEPPEGVEACRHCGWSNEMWVTQPDTTKGD